MSVKFLFINEFIISQNLTKIKAKPCISSAINCGISSTLSVASHQVAERYTLMRDDIQPKGLMISTTLRAVMIYQVCDLDKKITASEETVIF
jgi:hypothetical protein